MLDRFNTLVLSLYARAQREEGQTMAEYAMVLALIAIAVIVAVTGIGTALKGQFQNVASQL